MARLFRIRDLAADRRGAMAIIVALSSPVLIGGVGMMADVIQWTYMKRAMQRQADSAALAGAFALSQQANVIATATADLARNSNFVLSQAPAIENAPASGPMMGNNRAVRVALATNAQLPFVNFLMRRAILISAEATAMVVSQGQYCVLALEKTDTTGITMTGNTTVDIACGMMSNSPAAISVEAGGSAWINASPVAGVGGVPTSGGYVPGTQLVPYSVPQADPLAGLPEPVPGNAKKFNDKPQGKTTVSPGTYSGMNIQGEVSFNPGVYYVDGSSFSVGSQAKVSGDGVTIILTSSTAGSDPGSVATVDMNGGASINLTAPTSGTYAGVLFYQDRRALDIGTNKINGNASSKFQGALYFPSQSMWFNGTNGMDIKCLQMIGRRIDFNGNSTITNVCPSGSGASSFSGTRIKLVA